MSTLLLSTPLSKSILACGLALAAATLLSAPAAAAAEHKHPLARTVVKAKGAPKTAEAAPDEPEPDIKGSTSTELHCELGNKITMYQNENDASHIALRWKQRLHRLTRVGTSTGALRFENTALGLIWIGIPSKSMLLDSKQNRQLANECKSAAQEKPAVPAAPAAPAEMKKN